MATGFFRWSRTAASNASATYTWAEGMAPSSVNDSARGIMSDAAQFRDDISGAIATGGTSTAYTVTSFQVFDSLANMSGNLIAFTPHATNGATVTLNVDGLGAKPLRSAPSVELLAGTLIQGTPYLAIYNNSDAVWYLHGFYGNPYNIPLGGGMDYWLPTAPNSSFVFPIGQAISRTTYATLFAAMSTTYGVGDGTTTFNLPDKRGRVSAGMDPGNSTGRLNTAVNGALLGGTGGAQANTLTASQIPSITSAGTTTTTKQIPLYTSGATSSFAAGANTILAYDPPNAITFVSSLPATVTSNNTSGDEHNNVQPTIVCNYILRIL